MKTKIIKLVCIFLLFISLFRTGSISTVLNNINLFLFGNTFFWIIIMIILFITLSFFNQRIQSYYRKYLIALTLAGIGMELILNLIRINVSSSLDYNFFIEQTLLINENIQDKIGFVQTFFEVSLNSLFGRVGIIIIAFIIFGFAIFLILDIDTLFKSIYNFFRNLFVDSDENDEEIDETIDLKPLKASPKKEQKLKEQKLKEQKLRQQKLKEKKLKEQKLKEQKLRQQKGKKISKNDEFTFEPSKPIGNKNILQTEKKTKNISQRQPLSQKEVNKKKEKINSKSNDGLINIKSVSVDNKFKNIIPENKSSKVDVIGLRNNKKYMIPPVSLLDKLSNNDEAHKKLQKNAKEKGRILLNTLESFKVKAVLINIIVGSSITRYELKPESGQKVNKFLTLNNDLAMALAAKSIRIEAPIPGKSLVGIEVPNEKRLMVGLQELVKTNVYDKKNKLNIALGKGIEGEVKYLDIAKAPHVLVAGATGSGKSVFINGMITNILLNATPDEVKFLLIDPKKVELTPYDGIPHLLSPVITDPEKAAVALNRLVYEMENRYDLFADSKTRNIESYNKQEKENKLPYIVAIIDELADLMMVSGTEVEISISRIAQKARAAGIHLILATQRPSTDVITGLIKSNIPTRISFMVSSSIDSRTILDSTGAEKLLGNGDMLLSSNGSSNLVRIQGAYLSDDEISRVVEFINKQFEKEDIKEYYKDDFVKLEVVKQEKSEDEDPLLLEAIELGIDEKRISTSLLQRRLRIGFNRATTIIEQLEAKGWISKSLGNNKGREILATRAQIYGNKEE